MLVPLIFGIFGNFGNASAAKVVKELADTEERMEHSRPKVPRTNFLDVATLCANARPAGRYPSCHARDSFRTVQQLASPPRVPNDAECI